MGVSPLSEAWVATGMNIGSDTGPCGSVRIEARAFVVFHNDTDDQHLNDERYKSDTKKMSNEKNA